MDTNGDIRTMMRVLFNSDFFKGARFRRVKSPAELVAGVVKLGGRTAFPVLASARTPRPPWPWDRS